MSRRGGYTKRETIDWKKFPDFFWLKTLYVDRNPTDNPQIQKLKKLLKHQREEVLHRHPKEMQYAARSSILNTERPDFPMTVDPIRMMLLYKDYKLESVMSFTEFQLLNMGLDPTEFGNAYIKAHLPAYLWQLLHAAKPIQTFCEIVIKAILKHKITDLTDLSKKIQQEKMPEPFTNTCLTKCKVLAFFDIRRAASNLVDEMGEGTPKTNPVTRANYNPEVTSSTI